MKLQYEPKQIYDVSKGQALFKKALSLVPAGIYGHLGPSEGCMIPVSAYPLFMSRAQGTYIWDLNGNRYIDFTLPDTEGTPHDPLGGHRREGRRARPVGLVVRFVP